ncbi:hypothetical protein Pint_30127 [Pistacia integerrima]|uniref:Uncharacterized protein n=1 Tax=Pistacia integerrima TaxID=434235 RepID=A0ACC0X2C3_9ROSI|nr:hypothetical protein Pint_30127 [Pistacia integerrima]
MKPMLKGNCPLGFSIIVITVCLAVNSLQFVRILEI